MNIEPSFCSYVKFVAQADQNFINNESQLVSFGAISEMRFFLNFKNSMTNFTFVHRSFLTPTYMNIYTRQLKKNSLIAKSK